ncbi:hypothetical protein [Xanthomonas axonopodis]
MRVFVQKLLSERHAVRRPDVRYVGHRGLCDIVACRFPYRSDEVIQNRRAEQIRSLPSTMGRRRSAMPCVLSANHIGAAGPGRQPRDQCKDVSDHRKVDLQGLIARQSVALPVELMHALVMQSPPALVLCLQTQRSAAAAAHPSSECQRVGPRCIESHDLQARPDPQSPSGATDATTMASVFRLMMKRHASIGGTMLYPTGSLRPRVAEGWSRVSPLPPCAAINRRCSSDLSSIA